jgi:hypothetical protein
VFYYWPGIQKPGAVQQVVINKASSTRCPRT